MANPESQRRCVFVGNIPYDATEEQLVQICEEVGPVVSFRLVTDRETGKPKGYGFCEYKDEETALSARRNLQGYEINGRQLRVDFAENDKNTDKSREQGRGGPGMGGAADPQRNIGGSSAPGNSSLHQPIGHPVATTAATVMAGALGGAQLTSSVTQTGLQNQFGSGIDPLSHYLSKMSRSQLYEIISDMKAISTQNKEHARQLLHAIPNLPKAIFQAQLMLGLVTPQMLQMPNIRQSVLPDNQQLAMRMLPVVSQPLHSSLPQTQPQVQLPKSAENNILQQRRLPIHSGVQSFPAIQASTSSSLKQPMHHPAFQPSSLACPPSTERDFQDNKSAWLKKPDRARVPNDSIDEMNHPPKLSKLNDGRGSYLLNADNLVTRPSRLASISGKHISRIEEASSSEKHALQLTPYVDSTLLQQVLSLTPEQLSSLPPYQREQVLQHQHMLRKLA